MASSSDRSSRTGGGSASWQGGSSSKAGGGVTVSRPGRYLAVLAALLIVMFLSVLGGTLIHPGAWHTKFKVALGLDLSSGTTFTILAAPPHGGTPSSAEMSQSIAILNSRLNGQGFTGASVQQQGSSYIVVSVPNKSAEDIAPLLRSAVLGFRQVLLLSRGYPIPLPATPTPPPTPPAGTSPSPSSPASPSPSGSPKSSPSLKPLPSPSTSGSKSGARSGSGGSGQAASARVLSGAATPSPSASAQPSHSASTSPTPSATPSPSPTPSASVPPTTTRLPTAADAQAAGGGDLTKVTSAAVIKDFNRLNCHDKHWQKEIYGSNPWNFDNPNKQIVGCDNQGNKYILDVAKVQGKNLRNVGAALDQTTNQWIVQFGLDSSGASAFGTLTTQMYGKYFNPSANQATSVLDQFAIVLDGSVVSAPQIQQPITAGSGQITGPPPTGFTQGYANQLAAVLKYGAVPLAFTQQFSNSISAQLGSAQLTAVLIAAAIGLFLVVVYSFIYYRGLALVSVFSLATAALLAWLSVIILGKTEQFTLSLAGVAGLIVAIGITADSFVVFFERLRDEVREGRSLRAAVERGWSRARRTILVSDTVSFLAALLLYIFAIGDVKGFAFTLGLTTLIDVVVVFLFTKPMVTLLARTKFYGQGHRWSGLDPARLGARSPWRGSRPAAARPATGGAASARTTPKEA